MTDKLKLYTKLIELLAAIDFDRRYYSFYEGHRDQERKKMPGAGLEDFRAALAATTLDFTYHKKENFFSHKQAEEPGEIGLNIAFPHSSVELILWVKTRKGVTIGDPFSALALNVSEFRTPEVSPEPEFPTLPFSSEAELHEAVRFGVSLFLDARREIVSHRGWND